MYKYPNIDKLLSRRTFLLCLIMGHFHVVVRIINYFLSIFNAIFMSLLCIVFFKGNKLSVKNVDILPTIY